MRPAHPLLSASRRQNNWTGRLAFWVTLSVALLAAVPAAWARPASKVFLNGVPAPVFFNDGDSFTVLGGPLEGSKARLAGYNTLESFGPVHRWGEWTAHELYINAKMATLNARRGVWRCHSDLSRDGYGRILWTCPDLIVDQVRKGLGHPMTVTEEPSPQEQLDAMVLAQRERRGMWAKGIPDYVLTSTHSNDEGYAGTTYNRLVSTKTGASKKWLHTDNYKECQEVCHESGSCMVYVAFNKRYGAQRAACLAH